MYTIPNMLRSRSTTRQDLRRGGVDVITAPHPNSGPSVTRIVGHTSAAQGIDDPGEMASGDHQVEGLVEYTAQDAVDTGDGEEPDKTKEARIIQRATRRHILKHVEENSTDAQTIGRQRLFKLCKASANAVHVKYRKIYLGPVPHLLLCLEWITNQARGMKNTIKAQRADATLQELSDLIARHKEMR